MERRLNGMGRKECLKGGGEELSVKGEGWAGEKGSKWRKSSVCVCGVHLHTQDYDNRRGS